MCFRVFYTLKQGWHHRQQLSHIHYSHTQHLIHVDFAQHKAYGVKVIVLDFDGVLAPHGNTEPASETYPIIENCLTLFGENNVFILTNKPTPKRQNYFQRHFPSIKLIHGFRKKPYPEGLKTIIESAQVSPEETLLIDDRLLTGGLVACITGVKIEYISQPLVDYSQRPIIERVFQGLRKFERMLFPPKPQKDLPHENKNPRR